MVSINDVAKKAQVSISTVSRVMNEHPNVSAEKRKAVFQAVSDLNYIPNGLAQSLVTKSTNSVAILIADISNMFYSILVKSIEDVLNKQGYYTVIGNTEWDKAKEENYLKYLLQKQIDGFILASTSLEESYIEKLAKQRIPIVVLDRELDIDIIDKIRVDDFKGAYLATEHLIERNYEKLVHFQGPLGIASAEDRKKGFLQCVKDYKVRDKDWRILSGCFTEKCGIINMKKLLTEVKKNKRIGVFAANDAMALGGLKIIKENNLDCPEQVGIVGFDDVDIAEYAHPPLTTIKRPISEIGKIAANIILERLEKKNEDYFKKNITLDVRLIKRSST